ncbi:MAG: Rieske (2Fe-2S) protein [Sphingobium sp.]|jgi:nitrite reductase/ring-hydroxylating ferredoxin subunit|nr:Rieske (2Fe-2S) protein [Sphingobium sp.]MCP5398135.1 Rieske (2Fe-2S) protein [Sphingomonas sp.]
MPDMFHKVVKADEVEDRAMMAFIVGGWPVLVTRDEGTLHAVINRCSHAAAQLAPDGRVRRGAVMCPLHGARFKLENGECMGAAGYKPLKVFDLRETEDGWVEVAVPEEAPGAEHLPVKPLG